MTEKCSTSHMAIVIDDYARRHRLGHRYRCLCRAVGGGGGCIGLWYLAVEVFAEGGSWCAPVWGIVVLRPWGVEVPRVAIHSIHSTHHFGGMEMDASEISSVEWINLKVKLNGLTLNGRIEAIIHQSADQLNQFFLVYQH